LATFVATLDHPLDRSAQPHASQQADPQDLRFARLLTGALSLFSVVINGYHPYAEDGGLYLAGIKRLLNPALFPSQTAFVLEPMRFSLFAPLIAALVRLTHLSLPGIVLILHLATIWATLFACWQLASRCWATRTARAGAVVLLACWLALPVAGTALVLMDPYLTARSISTPCMVFALVAILDMTRPIRLETRSRLRNLGLCLASLALAMAMHPLMAVYAAGAALLLALLRSPRPRLRLWGTVTLCALALAAATCVHLAAAPEGAGVTRVALTRTYWFPAEWSWYELLGLAAPLAILSLFAAPRQPARTSLSPPAQLALAQMAIVAGALAFLIAVVFSHASAPNHLVARMQPLRVFQVVYLVMVLLLGAKLGDLVLRRAAWRWAAAMLLLGGVMFAAGRAAFPYSNHLDLPWTTSRNAWVQAFEWIRANTPQQALFALDPDYINAPGEDAQCFRAIAERSALPDYSKDGGEASIAPQLTPAWRAGQQAQRTLAAPSFTDAERLAALHPLGVTWIVLNAQYLTSFNCPYANPVVKVCRLP
jgi:type IV secretory pathway VirB2 component (pilin)